MNEEIFCVYMASSGRRATLTYRLQIQPAQYSWKIVHTIHSLLRVAKYDANLPEIGRYCFYCQIEKFPPF